METERVLLVYALVAFLALMTSTVAQPTKPTRLCGVKLPRTLALVCNHNYNKPSWAVPSSEDYDNYSSEQRRKRQVYQGIVDECCLKICTRSQLMAYCGDIPENLEPERREDRSAESPRQAAAAQTTTEIAETAQMAMRASPLIGTVAPEVLRQPHTVGYWIYA